MPSEKELEEKLDELGVLDLNQTLSEKQKRYARFKDTTFGIAPKHVWR